MDGSRILPGFENFDEPNVYHRGAKHILKANALNFVLEFDSNKALFASDLGSESITELLETTLEPTKTRWINLWSPEQQKETIKALATRYGFSRRTAGVMTSDPRRPAVVTTANQLNRKRAMLPWIKDRSSFDSRTEDLEMTPTREQPPSHATSLDMNHYRMVNEVWYYCSVDWGTRCKGSVRYEIRRLTCSRSLCRLQLSIACRSCTCRRGSAPTTHSKQASGEETLDLAHSL